MSSIKGSLTMEALLKYLAIILFLTLRTISNIPKSQQRNALWFYVASFLIGVCFVASLLICTIVKHRSWSCSTVLVKFKIHGQKRRSDVRLNSNQKPIITTTIPPSHHRIHAQKRTRADVIIQMHQPMHPPPTTF